MSSCIQITADGQWRSIPRKGQLWGGGVGLIGARIYSMFESQSNR